MDVYVGNLPFDVTEEELSLILEPFGRVTSVTLMNDSFSGRPLGFGFVRMPDDHEAFQAIDQLDRTKLHGRTLIVCKTPERTDRRVHLAESCYNPAH
jgi:RNA recognition motif-containing protein